MCLLCMFAFVWCTYPCLMDNTQPKENIVVLLQHLVDLCLSYVNSLYFFPLKALISPPSGLVMMCISFQRLL